MAETQKEYTRLAGRGTRRANFFTFASGRGAYYLWMANDHLLLVERTGYTENYRRFYFTDIQAIIIRKTAFATVLGAVTGLFALMFCAWALSVDNLPGRVTLWIICGVFALFFLINLILGPACVTHIQTVVQNEEIPSWGRLRATRKSIAKLRPRLREAQGFIPPDDLKARWQAGLAGQSDDTVSKTS